MTPQKKKEDAPLTVKIDGDWEDAVAQAMRKPKPEGGWPKMDSGSGKSSKAKVNKEKKPKG